MLSHLCTGCKLAGVTMLTLCPETSWVDPNINIQVEDGVEADTEADVDTCIEAHRWWMSRIIPVKVNISFIKGNPADPTFCFTKARTGNDECSQARSLQVWGSAAKHKQAEHYHWGGKWGNVSAWRSCYTDQTASVSWMRAHADKTPWIIWGVLPTWWICYYVK